MTRSDDNSGGDENSETKILQERLFTGEQSRNPSAEEKEEKKRNGVELSDRCTKDEREKSESSGSLKETNMGSTDSAGSTHTGGSSCGLVSSLFPNSCRGRAESFARRLHRRLTSLGGEANSTDDDVRPLTKKITETSRLRASQTEQRRTTTTSQVEHESVLECQPRHSPESDIYYDFNLEPDENGSDDTISPAEIANAAEIVKILVNPKILKNNRREACNCSSGPRPPDSSQENDGEYVFSSPLPGLTPDTDNSEAYFDPESSETDKSRIADTFFDLPGCNSESDAATSCVSNGAVNFKNSKFSGRRRIEGSRSNDISESSSSSHDPESLENGRSMGIPMIRSSEESVDVTSDISHENTTSPSHESLWSTFDDGTLSLRDESPLATRRNSANLPTRLAKSHSDSEIIGSSSVTLENHDEIDFTKKRGEPEKEMINCCSINHENNVEALSTINSLSLDDPVEPSIDGESTVTKNDHSICSSSGSNSSNNIEALVSDDCSSNKNLIALDESQFNPPIVNHSDDNNEDESKLAERLTRSIKIDATVDEIVYEEDEKSVELEESEKLNEEREDEDEERPRRVRRCSSLKACKTPPGTPGRKKIVRFADVLGLDLADVRTFLDEIPKVPNSAYSDLIYDEAFQKDSSPVNFWGTGPATFTTPLFAATMGTGRGSKLDRILVPLFQQPGGLTNFLDVVRERSVCLENVVVQDPVTMCLQGTVRVRNLDFHKSVHVRYTLDSWRNFSDLQATYATNSCDGFSDKFTFILYCHTLKIGQRLELAVRFQCKGTQYWDNNAGINYCFQCLPATPANPGTYMPIAASINSNSSSHEWSPTFY